MLARVKKKAKDAFVAQVIEPNDTETNYDISLKEFKNGSSFKIGEETYFINTAYRVVKDYPQWAPNFLRVPVNGGIYLRNEAEPINPRNYKRSPLTAIAITHFQDQSFFEFILRAIKKSLGETDSKFNPQLILTIIMAGGILLTAFFSFQSNKKMDEIQQVIGKPVPKIETTIPSNPNNGIPGIK